MYYFKVYLKNDQFLLICNIVLRHYGTLCFIFRLTCSLSIFFTTLFLCHRIYNKESTIFSCKCINHDKGVVKHHPVAYFPKDILFILVNQVNHFVDVLFTHWRPKDARNIFVLVGSLRYFRKGATLFLDKFATYFLCLGRHRCLSRGNFSGNYMGQQIGMNLSIHSSPCFQEVSGAVLF